jgi:hypothetical protein
MKSKYDKKDNTYERMLKERNLDKPIKKGYDYSKIRVKNSEDWHKFVKRGNNEIRSND